MKVIDFHVHVGTKEHWNPWVMDFFRQTNPFYYERFSEKITPEGLITYLKFQGVEKTVILFMRWSNRMIYPSYSILVHRSLKGHG